MNEVKDSYIQKGYNDYQTTQFKNKIHFLPQIYTNNSLNQKCNSLDMDNNYSISKNLLNNSYIFNQQKSQLMKPKQLENLPKIQQLNINEIPNIENSKCSTKKHGIIQSYAANTHQGMVRNYNEDRVSIILNIMQPESKKHIEKWPNCCFFAIYDGHGGSKCADFLRENLHQFIIKDENFPENPRKAIIKSIYKIEKMFLEQNIYSKMTNHDKSGSCIILLLQVDNKCYVANVGDSRAILSSNRGQLIQNLSIDHKPNLNIESKRIRENGGNIYQSYVKSASPGNQKINLIYGPYRVFPGKLSVSRTIGDADAKLTRYGGNPMCVICKPDIKMTEIKDTDDFIILGCKFFNVGDGVFDKLQNKDIIRSVWNTEDIGKDYHKFSGNCLDNMMKDVFLSRSTDNISGIIITFDNYLKYYNDVASQSKYGQKIGQSGDKIRQKVQVISEVNEIDYQPDKDDSMLDIYEQEIVQLNKNKLQKLNFKLNESRQSFNNINDNILQKITKK